MKAFLRSGLPTGLLAASLVFVGSNAEGETKMTISKSVFGKTSDGKEVLLFTCRNASGMVVRLTTYGAAVISVETPDRNGKLANINLGFEKLSDYEKHGAYFGCTVGRYANRIAKGKFSLDGHQYVLATNNGANHLHGGVKGFNRVVWQGDPIQTDSSAGVKFSYRSADGEEGFPGNLDVTATYVISANNELRIDYQATTDKTTVLNLTNHCYWNLSGAGSGTIKNHQLTLSADKYLPVDVNLIPTGKLASVKGTPLDFTKATEIGARLDEVKADPEGYDHCFVLRSQDGQLAFAALVKDPASGRVMEVQTTEPGIQFYTGNFLNGDPVNGGHKQHTAFCLETQHYPDSPNQTSFPPVVLKPGQVFKSTTVHKFVAE